MKILKSCRWHGVALLALMLALGCSDGPDDGLNFESLSDVQAGEPAQERSESAPPRAEPLFPVFESPAAAAVKKGEEGDPVVACDLRAKEGRMQADAYWDHFPENVNGEALSGYDYTWMVPNDDGTVSDVGSSLDSGHQGTSLLDNAMPAGGTLQFRLAPRYGAGSQDALSFTVPCNEIPQ